MSAAFISAADLMREDAEGPPLAPGWESAGEISRPAKTFRLETFATIRAELTGQWLIKQLLASTGLTVVFGPPGCGKSFLVLGMSLHVAAGFAFAGCRTRQAGVVYLAAEAGPGLRRRIMAARARQDLPDDLPFALVVTAPDLGRAEGDAPALIAAIREQAAAAGWSVGLVIIDTLARAIPGADENSSKDMGQFVENADKIGRELGCAVLAVHHTGKATSAGMRGSSALHGAADTAIEVSQTGPMRTAQVVKQKEASDDAAFSFRLEVVEIGRDEDGDPVTSCALSDVSDVRRSRPEPVKSAAPARVPDTLRLFMDALADALDGRGREVQPWPDGPIVRAVDREDLRPFYYDRRPDDDTESRKKGFKRHLAAAAEKTLVYSADVQGATMVWCR